MNVLENGSKKGPAPKPWLVLALVCAAQFMLVLDFQTVTLALPTIQRSLEMPQDTLQWVVSVYELVLGGGLLLAGRAADFFGAKRLFMVGLGLFAAAALLCGLAPTGVWLIVARGVQGLGSAMVLPVALKLLLTTFPDGPARTRALGAWGAAAPLGGFVGVLLGGYLVSTLGWPWVFFINVPVALLALVCAPWVLPVSPTQRARIDLLGAGVGTAGLVGLVYGLTRVGGAGIASVQALVPLGLGITLLIGFYFLERRTEQPLIPFTFFRQRTLLWANLLTLVIAAVSNTPFFFLTLYFQQVEGASAFVTGLAFLPTNVAIVAGSALGVWLNERCGAKVGLVTGLTLLVGALLAHARVSVGGAYVWTVLPGIVLLGLGLGVASVAANIAGTARVSATEQGLASALLNMAARLGTALGLALLVSVSSFRTETFAGAGGEAEALVAGFRWAFYGGAGLALFGLLLALTLRGQAGVAVCGEGSEAALER